jgi:SAM-dependent methyltransferase
MIELYKITSVLDLGAGTGRVARFLQQRYPTLKVISIEPVSALREIGYRHGLTPTELIDGDATQLDFTDDEFDLVCEFATLHHIRHPELAVREMLRVSKMAIFISDSNNFGQGSTVTRAMKQIANAIGLWRLVDWIKTKGRGYTISEGDGLGYSYSVYNSYWEISRYCDVHLVNTVAAGVNPYRTAAHVALLGLKRHHGAQPSAPASRLQ